LVTHASFKALLFLCAGSVIHSIGSNNIWDMGGLYKKMKVTALTFLVGGLALAGVFPTSGYFSKDAILIGTFNSGHYILFAMAMLTVAFTAFYMARVFFVVFFSTEKFGGKHPHESPSVMTIPLIILALFAVGLGFFTGSFKHFVFFGSVPESEHNLFIPVFSNIVAVGAMLFAWAMYQKQLVSAAALAQRFSAIYRILKNKYYIDEFYAFCVKWILFVISNVANWCDRNIVEGVVNGAFWVIGSSASFLRRIQTGLVQNYALAIFGGVILLCLLMPIGK
jgi:NADH-quinone oxidoreductase subunit L